MIDFTVPVDGLEVPWRLAKIVYVYDSARYKAQDMPRSVPAMLDWARAHPGRLTHPTVRNFLGATFLKQALYELAPSPEVLQSPATDANFAQVTAPLWAWYDQLRPHLWRAGPRVSGERPGAAPVAERRRCRRADLVQPVGGARRRLPTSCCRPTARIFVMAGGTIGNTSFVAVPYNAANKEAAMVVANFLLDPVAQSRQQDPAVLGNATVLDVAKLPERERQLFAPSPEAVGMPSSEELGKTLLEPHASWMTRITAEWEKRYSR